MRNSIAGIVKHWRVILIWVIGLSIGVVLALWNNNVQESEIVTAPRENNWFLICINFAIMAAFIPAGYFVGRKYDKGT
jgi:hypothetical protein